MFDDEYSDEDKKYYSQYKNNIKNKLDDKSSYDHFWKPIAEKLRDIKKIYFSPDGIYHLVNLATLKNPATGKFLLDEIEILYTTSGGTRMAVARPAETSAHITPAARRVGRLVLMSLPSAERRRATAPSISMPVIPPPIAASVSATSAAESLTQAMASSNP